VTRRVSNTGVMMRPCNGILTAKARHTDPICGVTWMKMNKTSAFQVKHLLAILLLSLVSLLALHGNLSFAAGPMPPTLLGVSYGEIAEWQAHYGHPAHCGYGGYAAPFPPYDPSCLVPPPGSVVRSKAGRSSKARKPSKDK